MHVEMLLMQCYLEQSYKNNWKLEELKSVQNSVILDMVTQRKMSFSVKPLPSTLYQLQLLWITRT